MRENFVRKVVDHDGAVEVCDRGIATVLLAYEGLPILRVHSIGCRSGVPEIDSTSRASILREDIDLTDKTRYALIFRCCTEEDRSCLLSRDGLWQPERGDSREHSNSPFAGWWLERRLTVNIR